MVWVFPEYGGQLAVRMGSWKAVRQQLKTKQPGAWELYDLANDRNETNNIAAAHPNLVAEAAAIEKAQTSPNATFPVNLGE
jgi:arylsulfatase A-like enzyme